MNKWAMLMLETLLKDPRLSEYAYRIHKTPVDHVERISKDHRTAAKTDVTTWQGFVTDTSCRWYLFTRSRAAPIQTCDTVAQAAAANFVREKALPALLNFCIEAPNNASSHGPWAS
jgi:hypothetical protein